MSESLLLTDTDDPSVPEAVARLDGWRVERLPKVPPPEASAWSGVRTILLHDQDPTALRLWTEYAHSVGIPVVIAVEDEAARRRAVELRAEEWYNKSSSADEIAARIRSAVGRGPAASSGIKDRVERVEFQEMLHDSLTGLPTLPVAIDRIRSQFKERGELIVLYLNFVRYSKIE